MNPHMTTPAERDEKPRLVDAWLAMVNQQRL
jgi:hypothetical protein